MGKVSKQTASKIGLFSAIMLIFGSVVGIGIFFKNYSVFSTNGGNWVGVLVSWIISIVMVLCIALSFGEVVTCKPKVQGEGLGGWAARYCGHKFGRFTKLFHTGVYYSVLTFAIMFFAGEALLNCFAANPGYVDFGKGTVLYVFLAGGGLFALFIFLNYFASKGMSKFSNITGIIKFVPIAAVIILGIVFGAIKGGGLWTGKWITWALEEEQWILKPHEIANFDVVNVIKCIPSILFAFEGYLVIGNVAGDMENPKKNVSLAIVLAMIIISVLNIAITIGCMTIGTGNVYHLMYVICGVDHINIANILNIIMSVFILICIIGVLNAMAFSGMRAFQVICEDGTLFKGKQLANKKPGKLFAGAVYFSIMISIWWLGIGIPSCILNTDAIADGSSSILIILIYVVYGTTLLGGFTNRFRKEPVEVVRIKIFPVTAIIAVIACFFVFAFSGVYQSMIGPIINPMEKTGGFWGLFVQDINGSTVPNILNETWIYEDPILGPLTQYGHQWRYWQTCIVFWSIAITMIGIPFINDLLISKTNKTYEQGFIWKNPRVSDLVIEKKYEKQTKEILERE